MIRCLSVCSGIEAWSCAVEGMDGYSVSALSEIEPFPCAVLAERYPFVPNLGDMTKINGWAMRGQIDLLVGGTPCQGFSVAGLRGGLNDPRSGLAGHYVRLAAELRVPWLLWENVPGALSTSGGADFRAFVSALDKLGYGLAWAVLDAQWFGVAQRRKRLFLVGRLGDWRGPGQVLFEPRRVRRNPPARRRKGEGDAPRAEGGAGAGCQPEVSGTITAIGSGVQSVGNRSLDGFTVLGQPNETAPAVTASGAAFARTGQNGTEVDALVIQPNEVSATLCASGAGTDRPSAQCSQEGFCVVSMKTDNTKANGCNFSDDPVTYTLDTLAPPAVFPINEERAFNKPSAMSGAFGNPHDPMFALDTKHVHAVAPLDLRNALRDPSREKRTGAGFGEPGDPANTLTSESVPGVAPLDLRHLLRDDASFGGLGLPNEPVGSLTCGMTGGGNPPAMAPLSPPLYPRRLTPLECERLQGFPDGWTAIQFQGKPAKDSHRYRALGNSMAVPVMRWLAEGIREFF